MRGLTLTLLLALIACGGEDSGAPIGGAGGSMNASGGAGGAGGSSGASGGSGGMTAGTGGMGGSGSGGAASAMDASTDSGDAHADAELVEDADSAIEAPYLRAWPTDDAVTEVDVMDSFGTDVSGLTYQPNGAGPGVLWASMNLAPSKVFRLEKSGVSWARTAGNNWDDGKRLLAPDGVGVPDAEGITKAEHGDDVVYIGSERNLGAAAGTSRNAVLSYAVSGGALSLTAMREWDLTSMLPATGPNLGLEAVTWIPDAALVAAGFVDESTAAAYDPNVYPSHGTGLFVVGLESQSALFFFALGSAGEITRVGSVETGLAGVMGLEYDRDVGYLWAYCDDTCDNRAVILTVNGDGAFERRAELMRPGSMANINNEGIAIAPESECSGGKKAFFWVEDGNSNGHVLRAGTIPCGKFL